MQRREPERRYPILLTLLAQSAVDVLDETLLLFDQAISGRESAAKQKVAEAPGRARPPSVEDSNLDRRAARTAKPT
nr:hypothetical protein [Micromonospora matsumotoense]